MEVEQGLEMAERKRTIGHEKRESLWFIEREYIFIERDYLWDLLSEACAHYQVPR